MTTIHLISIYAVVGFSGILCDHSKIGAFDVKLQSVSYCGPKTGRGLILDPLTLRKFNRTLFSVSASANLTMPFDDSLDLVIVLSVHTGNGWKENYFKQAFKKACSTAKSYGGNLFTMLVRNAGAKASCPVPKGFYTIKDLPLTIVIEGIPVFFYGKYKFRLSLLDKAYIATCVEGVAEVLPKSKH